MIPRESNNFPAATDHGQADRGDELQLAESFQQHFRQANDLANAVKIYGALKRRAKCNDDDKVASCQRQTHFRNITIAQQAVKPRDEKPNNWIGGRWG